MYPASDATLYALDARTGKVNWKFKFSSYGRDKIGGMMIADGKLIVGLGVCDEPSLEDRCFIAAYDVNDGHQLWKFSTVAYADPAISTPLMAMANPTSPELKPFDCMSAGSATWNWKNTSTTSSCTSKKGPNVRSKNGVSRLPPGGGAPATTAGFVSGIVLNTTSA